MLPIFFLNSSTRLRVSTHAPIDRRVECVYIGRVMAKYARFALRLEVETLDMLKEVAAEMGVTASDFVRLATREKHRELFGLHDRPKAKAKAKR